MSIGSMAIKQTFVPMFCSKCFMRKTYKNDNKRYLRALTVIFEFLTEITLWFDANFWVLSSFSGDEVHISCLIA